jgi:hypothetical protein
MDGPCNSLDGNKSAQIFASKDLFTVLCTMESKSHTGEGLRQFMQDFGRPASLTIDGSRQQCWKKTEFMNKVHKYDIYYHITEPDSVNHNFAEYPNILISGSTNGLGTKKRWIGRD